jgi:hypothetical protein
MNTGFIKFPVGYPTINQVNSGRTFVYISAFDTLNAKDKWSNTANIHINQTGTFVSDDAMTRPSIKNTKNDVDDIVNLENEDKQYDRLYFPHEDKTESVPMQAAICIGWVESTFENKVDYKLWHATFRDLTKSGRELFYLMKKLHYNREVRILTFSE